MLSARMVLVLMMLLTLSPRCDAGLHTLSECCFEFRNSPIRLINLKDFYKTPEDCFYKAIVFETKKGIKICVKPEAAWVKQVVEKLQKKKELHAP